MGDVLPGIVHVNVQLRSGEEFESVAKSGMQHKLQTQRGLGFVCDKQQSLVLEITRHDSTRHDTCDGPFCNADLPNVDAVVGAAQADDFGTRRCLDQVVDLAIWDEILVVGILGEEREFELFGSR